MAKKLLEKAGLIQHPALPSAVRPSNAVRSESTTDLKPKTAPGAMMHFLATQSHAMKETELLKEKLESFVGSSAVRLLTAARVVPSRWANRHPASFEAAQFIALREEIRSAGGTALALPCDVRERMSMHAAVAQVARELRPQRDDVLLAHEEPDIPGVRFTQQRAHPVGARFEIG